MNAHVRPERTGVRPERTGVRRIEFNNWHREQAPLGCFMLDLDCVEYRRGREAVALIEVKFGNGFASSSQRKCLVDLADRAGLPLYLVRYEMPSGPGETATYRFNVLPWNDKARGALAKRVAMSTAEMVEWLRAL